eukprot:TRINITY_DN6640_c0_g1_i1.p1 TRINITY_DN6640_c0_g1~~TRINITY_DN6640_c0_g1_i1.p1  ORF type:complete len:270 (-),score=44.29 TRINITY_DN6640_c0_g1_i1:222-1031(-)
MPRKPAAKQLSTTPKAPARTKRGREQVVEPTDAEESSQAAPAIAAPARVRAKRGRAEPQPVLQPESEPAQSDLESDESEESSEEDQPPAAPRARGTEIAQIDGNDTAYRVRHAWTPEEVRLLRKGVKKYQNDTNRWTKILNNFDFPAYRTAVDLKDKWRVLEGNKRTGWTEHAMSTFEIVGTEMRFQNRFPRDAALKAATKGIVYILVRRQEETRVHMYRGSIMMNEPPPIPKFANKKSVSDLIKVPHVQKIQILENIEVVPEASRVSR